MLRKSFYSLILASSLTNSSVNNGCTFSKCISLLWRVSETASTKNTHQFFQLLIVCKYHRSPLYTNIPLKFTKRLALIFKCRYIKDANNFVNVLYKIFFYRTNWKPPHISFFVFELLESRGHSGASYCNIFVKTYCGKYLP